MVGWRLHRWPGYRVCWVSAAPWWARGPESCVLPPACWRRRSGRLHRRPAGQPQEESVRSKMKIKHHTTAWEWVNSLIFQCFTWRLMGSRSSLTKYTLENLTRFFFLQYCSIFSSPEADSFFFPSKLWLWASTAHWRWTRVWRWFQFGNSLMCKQNKNSSLAKRQHFLGKNTSCSVTFKNAKLCERKHQLTTQDVESLDVRASQAAPKG